MKNTFEYFRCYKIWNDPDFIGRYVIDGSYHYRKFEGSSSEATHLKSILGKDENYIETNDFVRVRNLSRNRTLILAAKLEDKGFHEEG